MKINTDIKKRLAIASRILTLGTIIVTFFPWIGYLEHRYTIISFYRAVHEAGGFAAFANGDVYIYPAFVITVLPVLVALLSVIRFFLEIFRGRINWMNNTIYLIEGVYMVLLFSFYGWDPTMWNLIVSFFVLTDFMIGKFLADYNMMTKQKKALEAAHKKANQERKRRLYFPGKYSKQVHRLMLAASEENRRNRMLLSLVGAVTTSYTFSVFVLSRSLQAVHSEEALFLGNGMEASLTTAMFVAFLLDAVVMALVISRVLSGREKSDARLIKLGAREDLIRRSWTVEMAYCCLISLALGFVLGLGEVYVLLQQASKQLGSKLTISIGIVPILATAGIMILIFLFTTLWNHERMIQRRYYNLQKRGADYIPTRRLAYVLLVVGIGMAAYGGGAILQRRNYEDIKLYVLLILGLAVMLVALASLAIRRMQSRRAGNTRAYARTLWTFSFRKTMEMVLVVFAIGAMLAVPVLQCAFLSQAEKTDTKSLYPYDIVAVGYDADETYFYQIAQNSTKMIEIPMVRVTSVQGEPYSWQDVFNNSFLKVMWPQGQNIGISWSSYQRLCKLRGQEVKCSAPTGEEIVIVYQQDQTEKAHPLDYYSSRTKPFLREGQPMESYYSEERKYLYPPRTVHAQFEQNLIGMLNRGSQENLVVYADDYFEALEGAEGPNHLYLIQASGEGYENVCRILDKVAERNAADARFDREIRTYYVKSKLMADTQSERYFQRTMMNYEILMMLICLSLILLIYSGIIRQELVRKYRLLHKLGMPEKMQRSSLRQELNSIYVLSLALVAGVSAAYVAAIFGLRSVSPGVELRLLAQALPYWVLLAVVILGFWEYMYRSVMKATGGYVKAAAKVAKKWEMPDKKEKMPAMVAMTEVESMAPANAATADAASANAAAKEPVEAPSPASEVRLETESEAEDLTVDANPDTERRSSHE
jgi:hypothetical protein